MGGKNLENQRRRYGSNHRSRPYRYLYAAVRDAEAPETHHSVRKVGGEACLCKGTLSGCHCNNTGGVHGVHRCIAGTTLLGFPMPLFEHLHAMTLFPSTKTPILCSGGAKTREKLPILTQKWRFCARNARKWGFRRAKAHKNPDFVLGRKGIGTRERGN